MLYLFTHTVSVQVYGEDSEQDGGDEGAQHAQKDQARAQSV